MNDELDGGADSDYVDGGVGMDTVLGGAGDDIVRGGGNIDSVHGGAGIDHVYGDDGNDVLYGDAGNGSDQTGQRLYGGAGDDELYAYAPDTDFATQAPLRGDELDGGAGNDWLYGNIRSELLIGGSGNDTLLGDWLIGPNYATSPVAAVEGGADLLFGDGGSDVLRGGGGEDELYGGADGDVLEGQNGLDYLYGGSGIDFITLDTSEQYTAFGDVFDGHYGNRTEGDVPDDNATDILLIEGTQANDTILLKESDVGISSQSDGPATGRLGSGAAATFTLTLNGLTYAVSLADNPSNTKLDHLVGDLNAALVGAGLPAGVARAARVGGRIRIETVDQGRSAELEMTGLNDIARDVLGFTEGQFGVALLTVEYNGQSIVTNWRSATGAGLVEQFRVQGLMGDDMLGFASGPEAPGLGEVSARSRDFVGVLDGGPGDDMTLGSAGRDRIDGGAGSDVLYGFGGDDRLWGDAGAGDGDASDHDTLFAGEGNDDLIGGQGTNRLYAWSFDPLGSLHFDNASAEPEGGITTLVGHAMVPSDGVLTRDTSFSLSVAGGPAVTVNLTAAATANNTSRANLVADLQAALNAAQLTQVLASMDADGRMVLATSAGTLEIASAPFGVFANTDTGLLQDTDGGGLYELEDTGLNRMLGMYGDDKLFGGTGLDFLYGNGGADELYTREGLLFEAGQSDMPGDAWKDYARATDKVWYYGGTNNDDVINVDFVTEPGLLADHHLITRLTDNNGSYTFDAQVRLDFNATDDNGDYIWDPSDLLVSLADLADADPSTRQVAFDEIVLSGGLLPPEGDILAIIIDALDGDDRVTVGPTVQTSVWVDGGAGDDHLEIMPGKALLPDKTDSGNRNDVQNDSEDSSRAYALSGPAGIALDLTPQPVGGSALFGLRINGASEAVEVTVPIAHADQPALFVDDANAALDAAGLTGIVEAVNLGGSVVLRTVAAGAGASLAVALPNSIARAALGLADGQAATGATAAGSVSITGLTIDNAQDVDWYSFDLFYAGASGSVQIDSASDGEQLDVSLYRQEANGSLTELGSQTAESISFALAGLVEAGGTCFLKITGNRSVPMNYAITLDIGDGTAPAAVDMSLRADTERRDILLGGAGNDVLSGGSGEDWIFGGSGNDVLTGGVRLPGVGPAVRRRGRRHIPGDSDCAWRAGQRRRPADDERPLRGRRGIRPRPVPRRRYGPSRQARAGLGSPSLRRESRPIRVGGRRLGRGQSAFHDRRQPIRVVVQLLPGFRHREHGVRHARRRRRGPRRQRISFPAGGRVRL